MILYQALSAYQILECMVHRQMYYRDRKCVLILGDYIKERMPRYFELETKRFFNEVYLFRFGGYRGSEEEIIRQVGEELARSIPYRPQDFERILIAGIHTYLQVYLLSEGISFEMFEDGSGALSRPWVLAQIHQKRRAGAVRPHREIRTLRPHQSPDHKEVLRHGCPGAGLFGSQSGGFSGHGGIPQTARAAAGGDPVHFPGSEAFGAGG